MRGLSYRQRQRHAPEVAEGAFVAVEDHVQPFMRVGMTQSRRE